jgi:hypothetical protein
MRLTSGPDARRASVRAFGATIDSARGGASHTEITFREKLLAELSAEKHVIAEGWYVPPPHGIAVISDTARDPQRISVSSLRYEEYWPSTRPIDFRSDLLYTYCSPISRLDSLPGDFAITLYFGPEPRIIAHIERCLLAVGEVLAFINSSMSSRELYRSSRKIFDRYELRNEVLSLTDKVPNDLGHSLPRCDDTTGRALSGEQRDRIRSARRFLNDSTEWRLDLNQA